MKPDNHNTRNICGNRDTHANRVGRAVSAVSGYSHKQCHLPGGVLVLESDMHRHPDPNTALVCCIIAAEGGGWG